MSSNPSPIPQRFRVNVANHDNAKNYSELTNGSSKHNSSEITDVVKKDIPNDSLTHVVDSEKKHSLFNRDLNPVNAVDIKSNGSTGEETTSKTVCEKTPFLHHIDSEDHNDNIDSLNQNYSSLTSNVIAKISNPQMASNNFRDV